MRAITEGMSADEVRALVSEVKQETRDAVLVVGRRQADRHGWCSVYDREIVPDLESVFRTPVTIEVGYTVTGTLRIVADETSVQGVSDLPAHLSERLRIEVDPSFTDQTIEIRDVPDAEVEVTSAEEFTPPEEERLGAPEGYVARATSDGRVLHYVSADQSARGFYTASMCGNAASAVWLSPDNAARVPDDNPVCRRCHRHAV